MLIDLHSHYPMHVAAGEWADRKVPLARHWRSPRDLLRAWTLRQACRLGNYQGPGGGPAVTLATLGASKVRVALSVLYAPFDEMDLSQAYGAPPRAVYFADLLEQMRLVEQSVAGRTDVVVVREGGALDAALAAGRVALVHAVEGAFHLGDTVAAVQANVATLAERGVAYITVAHLFWRQVATNAPALPFLKDWLYAWLFPQPDSGLTDLGRAAVRAMVEHGILLDMTHMSEASLSDTLALLDQLDPEATVPILASHAACDFGNLKYNLTDGQILKIAARRGVIGLIACTHYISGGLSEPRSFAESIRLLCRHIDHIHEVTGSHEYTAFGSDQDGFIKPTLPGLETPAGLGAVEAELAKRYGDVVAGMICSSNALRVLASWGRPAALRVAAGAVHQQGGPDARPVQ